MTCLPHDANTTASTNANIPKRRIITTSRTWIDAAVGTIGAIALAAAFPTFDAAWLAPLGLAAIFWTWRQRSPATAALIAFAEGTLFFALVFSWFGETVGAYVGPFAFIVDLGPALAEAPAFALAAALTAFARPRVAGPLLPTVTALAFTLAETGRTSGVLGVPFGTIAEPLVTTPLAPLAAFGGGALLTLVAALLAAYLARAFGCRTAWRGFASATVTIALATALAFIFWPARTAGAATIPVAAVQGNIRQDLKWNPATLATAVDRYVTLTGSLAAAHPRIVVWPETVITTFLNAAPQLQAQFAALARSLDTTLIVGSDERTADGIYNALYYFAPNGSAPAVYAKRRLVPFAEYLPGRAVLGALPYADLISDFAAGTTDAVIEAGGLATAPLVCWESGFAGLTETQIRAGAQLLVISTDDAWFGRTGGPYQHAQLAQLRAVETGRWVIRAASTGISGIIAPDGRYAQQSAIGQQAVILGNVGAPQPTLFSRIGPHAIALVMIAVLIALVIPVTRPQ